MGTDTLGALQNWRLNERHYGALQGLDKAQAVQRWGLRQVQKWQSNIRLPF